MVNRWRSRLVRVISSVSRMNVAMLSILDAVGGRCSS